MTDNSYKTAGEKLRAKRLELKLSLETARRRTKIPLRYLQALEEGDASPFPAQMYRRSFLNEYGEYLGLRGLAPEEEAPEAPAPAQTPEAVTAEQPAPDAHKKTIFLSDAEPVEQETLPLETRSFASRFALAAAVLALLGSFWTWRNASARNWSRNFETAMRTDRVYENFFISHLSAETTARTWARIDADGETLYEGYLPAGARKRWSAAKSFVVKLSDPSSARFLLDNRPIPDAVFKASAAVSIPVTFSGFTQTQ